MRIFVAGERLVGAALNRRKREAPAEAEDAVAAAGVVGEAERRHRARATRRERKGNRDRRRPVDRVDRELLVDPLEGAAAFGQADRRDLQEEVLLMSARMIRLRWCAGTLRRDLRPR